MQSMSAHSKQSNNTKIKGNTTAESSNLADEPTLAVLPPHLKLLDEKVTAMRFHTVNENPFETVNLLENIREIPVYIRIQIPKADGPPQMKLAEL